MMVFLTLGLPQAAWTQPEISAADLLREESIEPSVVQPQPEISAADLLREEGAEFPMHQTPPESLDAVPNSFGLELEALSERVNISAYGDTELYFDEDTLTFDQAHANPIIGAPLGDGFYAEMELEFEHGGEKKLLEYAYLDWNKAEWLTLRMGKFLLPVGFFNENLHPSFRNQLVSRPIVALQIIPSTWGDTGIQLRGRLRLGPSTQTSYKLFVVNGLQELEGQEGGEIRSMRYHERDLEDKGKAFGGRLEIAQHLGTHFFHLAASGYHGAISADGAHDLTIGDIDFKLRFDPITLHGEGAIAKVDQSDGTTDRRWGLYGQLTWAVNEMWSTSLRYDLADLDEQQQKGSAGLLCAFNTHVRLFFETSLLRQEGSVHPSGRSMLSF